VLPSHIRWPRPRARNPVARAARAIWTLPTNLIGHAAGLLVSGRLPRRVGGPAAAGWLYPIRPGLGLDWVGAVTLGHAILHRPGMLDGDDLPSRLTLAHELAHTRQHDWLGPLYLPLHILAQATSALITLARPPTYSRVHDWNPLEQTFICLAAASTHGPLPDGFEVERFLARWGV
jgi:hypothetical protein